MPERNLGRDAIAANPVSLWRVKIVPYGHDDPEINDPLDGSPWHTPEENASLPVRRRPYASHHQIHDLCAPCP